MELENVREKTLVKPGRRLPRLALGLLVSAAALAGAFWGVRPERFLQLLVQADYLYLLPAAALILMGLAARARSWQILLGEGVPLRRAFSALNEGYLLNNVLPFRLGEVGRAYMVSRRSRVSAAEALSSVLVERIIDVVVSLSGFIVAFFFVVSPGWARQVAWAAGGTLVIALAGVLLLVSRRHQLRRLLEGLPRRWLPIGRLADTFVGGLGRQLSEPRRLARASFWSTVAWGTAWLQLWFLLKAFGSMGTAIVSLFVLGVTAFGAALPSSPGAIGVYELSTVAGLMVFDYPREVALGVAVVSHGLQLGIMSLLGAVALARDGETVLGLAGEAQALLRDDGSVER